MDTHRDGITTWVASFAKNHFFGSCVLCMSMYDYLLFQMTENSGRIDQATHLPFHLNGI